MAKMTMEEWRAAEEERRKLYKELGVTDLNAMRVRRMWDDPSVRDEDIPAIRFVFDAELGQFVFANIEDRHGN